jgi:hypothetical protein
MSILLSKAQRQHHVDSPYWSDYYNHIVDPYLEICNNKENLVICYGDSWTWGDSLGNVNVPRGIDDVDFRRKNIYACHLSQHLNADFVNYAVPGVYNYWIHDRLDILLEHDLNRLCDQYSKIYIVVTLTELGRDFDLDLYITDFHKFYPWDHDPDTSGKKLLEQAEKFDFHKLRSIQDQLPDNCQLIVGRNFTNTQPNNLGIVKNLISKNWTEVLLAHQGITPISGVLIMSHGLDRFDNFMRDQQLDTAEYKQWVIDEIGVTAKKQLDFLNNSVYNYKKKTKHPTPAGHELWANYLVDYITENGL